MQKEKEESMITQPSQAKPQQTPLSNGKRDPSSKEILPNDGEYNNEFLNPLQNAKSFRTPKETIHPSKEKEKVNKSNRSKTEPRQQLPTKPCRRKQLLLPEIKGAGESMGVVGAQRDGRLAKLRQLYQKKSKLFRRLQLVNKKLIQAKMDISFPQHPSLPLGSTLHPSQTNPPPIHKPHSRSHGNSRNTNHYFLDLRRTKHPSPQSITSIDKNRQVISFIQKMHEQSVQRDLNRYERSQKMVANQLSDVCLECSRGKCQADAVGRILKESRFRV